MGDCIFREQFWVHPIAVIAKVKMAFQGSLGRKFRIEVYMKELWIAIWQAVSLMKNKEKKHTPVLLKLILVWMFYIEDFLE